ncbi:MAG: zinc-regulated TonB-dependent outer membrane receptor [Chitinophagaceae bacterium]|nr:zinc-regulated TonB-dependent outer membrane receptor [Oligoflexus sp.]
MIGSFVVGPSKSTWTSFIVGYLFILSSTICFGQSEQNSSSPGAGTGSSVNGNPLNPDISLDGLFSLSQFNNADPLTFSGGHDPKESGFNLQQVELTLGSNVDPYFRADANLVMIPERSLDGSVVTKIEVEEAYLTTTQLPWNLQIKAGSFFNAFGRQNSHHPHAWDFVNKPLVLSRMFGGDGLRNPGAQISWLTPLPWYSELITSSSNSTGETAASFRPEGRMRDLGDSVFLLKWNNFVSLQDDVSLNIGANYLTGPNANLGDKRKTDIVGADFYLKYRDPASLSFLALQAEVIQRRYDTSSGKLNDWGWYAQIHYRMSEPYDRWHIGLRYDWVSQKKLGSPITSPGLPNSTTGLALDRDINKRFRVSPVITFFPSEFSKLRLQYDFDKPDSFKGNNQQVVSLQFEYTIGAHGAHKF